jgi:hypothetical protein
MAEVVIFRIQQLWLVTVVVAQYRVLQALEEDTQGMAAAQADKAGQPAADLDLF